MLLIIALEEFLNAITMIHPRFSAYIIRIYETGIEIY